MPDSTILSAALSTPWKQHSIVLSVPRSDIGQALGPVVGLCGEAVERGMGVYISERAQHQYMRQGRPGRVKWNRLSGKGREKQSTKQRISFNARDLRRRDMCADDTTRCSILGSPSHGASACHPHVATEHSPKSTIQQSKVGTRRRHSSHFGRGRGHGVPETTVPEPTGWICSEVVLEGSHLRSASIHASISTNRKE